VRVGFIGVGNRGDQVLDAFLQQPDVEIAAVCDIHQPYVDFAVEKAGAAKAGGRASGFSDYRRLLDVKDVDAVVINTPDHWHALQTIHACQAGKDVYVEKPMSLCVAEGRKMVEAVRKYKRVGQVGIQRASSPMVNEAADLIRSGGIGKVTFARCFHVQNEWPKGIGKPADEPPPPGFDWDAWLGPAPKVAYNKNRSFYRFRWFFDYSGGQLTNFGVHYTDTIQRALGHDAPLAVVAMGGKLAIDDNREIPDTMEVLWTYPGGTLVSFTQINASAAPAALKPCEIEFRGTKGTLYLYGSGYEVVPDNLTPNEFPARTPLDRTLERGYRAGAAPMLEPKQVKGDSNTAAHARNFVDCVKSRQAPTCDIEVGHRRTSATLIGNVAWRLRAYLEWDRDAERFTNNAEANKRLRYEYRPPLKFPDAV
jgi:predicted dehydrogenase